MVDILFGKNYNVLCSRASAKFKSKRLLDTYLLLNLVDNRIEEKGGNNTDGLPTKVLP